jgi:hypothetical protein
MTGLLGIGPDDGVDLVGQGTLHITRVTEGGTSNLLFIYDFSPPADSAAVAEPATLALLAPGIVAILTLRRRFLTR